jgi:alcohol dehydrogenase class IV
MGCCHYHSVGEGCDSAFTVDTSRITFGRGCLAEVGDRARALGMKRVALFSDERVARLPHFEKVRQSLSTAGLDVVVYTDVHVEPTDRSFLEAVRFASEVRPDGYISLGGGSVIDTCKAANLYATHPTDFLAYVNAPVGDGRPVPGPLKPHIACPTTSGTGSEVTGITIFDLLSMHAKTGIASPRRSSTRTAPPLCPPRWSPPAASTCCPTRWSPIPRGRMCAVPPRLGRACGP